MSDYKEFARQMRENVIKNEQGNVVCSPKLWEEIANVIERAIIPPCKVGDTVWVISHWYKYTKPEIESRKILSVQIYKNGNIQYHYKDGCFWKEFIGKTVFLTKEEAEEKLKELNKGE